MKIFSQRLKQMRGKESQASFAKLLGLSQVSYGRYELGQREPDLATLYQIGLRLNVSIDWLLGLSENPTPSRHIPSAVAQGNGNIAIGTATHSTITNGHPPTIADTLADTLARHEARLTRLETLARALTNLPDFPK